MLTQGVTLFCMYLFSSTYGPACNKATDATLIQTGLQSDYSKLQSYVTTSVASTAENVVGKDFILTTVAGYTLLIKRKVQISIACKPIVDSISLNADGKADTISLGLGWKF